MAEQTIEQTLPTNGTITVQQPNMTLAMVGLGKMGANMTTRLLQGGHQLVVYDPIINHWAQPNAGSLATYQPGSWGPAFADELLTRDGRVWRIGD